MHSTTKTTLAVSIATLLTACGGGGGSSSSTSTAALTGSTYNGANAAASITTDNADDISGLALDNAPTYTASVTSQTPTPTDTLLNSQQTINRVIATAMKAGESANTSKAVSSNILNGDAGCGGSMNITAEVSDSTLELVGFSVTANDYGVSIMGSCEYIDGGLSLEQTGNTFTITYDELSYYGGEEGDSIIDGEAVMTVGDADTFLTLFSGDFIFEPTTIIITSNLVMTQGGETYKFEDLTITEIHSGFSGDSEITMSGRFYHPDYGYVDIETPDALVPNDFGTVEFTEGSIRFTGESSSMTLSFSGSSYNVDLDEDGDGTAELTGNGCTGTIETCLGLE